VAEGLLDAHLAIVEKHEMGSAEDHEPYYGRYGWGHKRHRCAYRDCEDGEEKDNEEEEMGYGGYGGGGCGPHTMLEVRVRVGGAAACTQGSARLCLHSPPGAHCRVAGCCLVPLACAPAGASLLAAPFSTLSCSTSICKCVANITRPPHPTSTAGAR
jgi:hypothetical protein